MPVQVILLNGVSSAGKTSLAAAIQRRMPQPWLTMGVDTMIVGMPPQYNATHDGLLFYADGRVVVGPKFAALEAAWRIGLGAMARSGLRLVLDEVLFDGPESQRQWNAALAGLEVLWVGVKCDLAVLEAREKARGDRVIGMAAKQLAFVHDGIVYDLEVDTSRVSTEECAEEIVERCSPPP
jgi:chloramphenicol 3-O phosphotransferase